MEARSNLARFSHPTQLNSTLIEIRAANLRSMNLPSPLTKQSITEYNSSVVNEIEVKAAV